MTLHLATFDKILFNKGGSSGTKCTKVVFGLGSAPQPLATTLPHDTQSTEEGDSVPHFASYEYSLTAVVVGSRCDVVSGELARRCVRRGAVEDSGSGVVHRMWAW